MRKYLTRRAGGGRQWKNMNRKKIWGYKEKTYRYDADDHICNFLKHTETLGKYQTFVIG